MERMRSFLPAGNPFKSSISRVSFSRTLGDFAVGILISAAVAFLFYRSVWALAAGGILVPLYVTSRRRSRRKVRTGRLKEQFISGMQMVSGSLKAGYSMENAWQKAEMELCALYGPDAEFCVEMHQMNRRLAINEPLEKVLTDFADDCGVEDIRHFAEIFSYAKRSGGNLNRIIHSVTERMREKAEILAEIETSVAAKKMEQRMMNFLLPGILLFVTISSPSYVTALYHNPLGIFVMSGTLAGYLGCICWSEKLIDIPI